MTNTRVLVVEDEHLIREIMVDLLTGAGFQVDQAESADQAAKLIDGDGYGLILTDINMPGRLDGIDLAAYARGKDRGIPILFVTGRPETAERVRSSGALSAVVHKPYSPEALVQAARGLVSASKD